MNKQMLRKNVNDWVRLRPIAHRLQGTGHPLPQIDDVWRIESVSDEGVRIALPRTGHGRLLQFDQICEFTSDRMEKGVKYGFLTLKIQLSIQGNDVHVTPTRPGVAAPPRIPADPIKMALLQGLRNLPTQFIPAGSLSQFPREQVVSEIARCQAEGLLQARLLRGEGRVLDAVALQIRPSGNDWLERYCAF